MFHACHEVWNFINAFTLFDRIQNAIQAHQYTCMTQNRVHYVSCWWVALLDFFSFHHSVTYFSVKVLTVCGDYFCCQVCHTFASSTAETRCFSHVRALAAVYASYASLSDRLFSLFTQPLQRCSSSRTRVFSFRLFWASEVRSALMEWVPLCAGAIKTCVVSRLFMRLDKNQFADSSIDFLDFLDV